MNFEAPKSRARLKQTYFPEICELLNDEETYIRIEAIESFLEVFCVCWGSNSSGIFVAYVAETECLLNGWPHLECTDYLKNKT